MKLRKKGFTLIELMIVIAIIAIIAAIAIPNLIEARKHGNEAAAIGALKTITTQQNMFRESDKDGDGTLNYGNLTQLGETNLIDPVLSTGTKQGYFFESEGSDDLANAMDQFLWWATAIPARPGTTGDRYFFTNHAGVIYYTGEDAPNVDETTCDIPANMEPTGR